MFRNNGRNNKIFPIRAAQTIFVNAIIYKNKFTLKIFFIILLSYLLHRSIVCVFSAMLRELACYAVEVDKKCGILAMDTYVQILHKIDPGCGRTPDFLPEVIRLYRLEKEEENVLTNIFKKRR